MTPAERGIVIAVPKGRILSEFIPLLERSGIRPEKDFYDEDSRKLEFSTGNPRIRLIRVRSFDVPTFVSCAAAQVGVAGSDVLMEFDYPDVYAPLDLEIGRCRLSVAEPEAAPAEELARLSHVRVATKYPHLSARYFAKLGIQAECIRLSGAMELAPKLGLARRIVDLVATGGTLKANGLKETAVIAEVSSRLIVNRAAFKTMPEVGALVQTFRELVHAH